MRIHRLQATQRGTGYAMVLFLMLLGAVSVLIAGNWTSIRMLHRDKRLLEEVQNRRWSNSVPSIHVSTNATRLVPPP